jgi:ankyrin repeat protein
MIRAPQITEKQQNLFITLTTGDPSCKKFLAACDDVDTDAVIRARDMRDEYSGLTLLHLSARLGYVSAVQHLLSIGHEIDVFDTSVSRVTPLMEAISASNIEVVGMLVKFGANLSLQDVKGENAFHYAARSGSRIVKCLIKNSSLSKEQIQALVCVTNIKLKFPEDVAINSLTKEVLVDLRERGYHLVHSRSKVATKKKTTNK